ncbi:hypothetical protein CROQUDRAFT_98892 [Cronartium quercuum f. sp. fusiforme G11]|uniref:Uncharacterized protein n=1 Tax=Cronartium quercuum f. sp. fusiforme G11 TaxID=708437 RepID=A0A9P6N7L2_9BASI|nr:hypothetical protein CROQUDRAFT_98892 [Cronartium quercuum f. sp. fusiforme G11]
MALNQLGIFCAVMFLTTYLTTPNFNLNPAFLIGSIPLSLSRSISPLRNRQLSLFGVGLLLGTALTVIIPEGISTLLGGEKHSDLSNRSHDHPSSIGLALLTGFIFMFSIDQACSPGPPSPGEGQLPNPSISTTPLAIESGGCDQQDLTNDHSSSSTADTLTKPLLPALPTSRVPAHLHQSLLATTIGLLTHSLADGISLGASATLGAPSLDALIFFAILVHKAPVACALVSVLVADGVPRSVVRRVLVGFSLAAPIGALLTFALVSAALGSTKGERTEYWIGLAFLFSGGTFLFVAMHAMLHLQQPHPSCGLNGLALGKIQSTSLVVGGMIAPACLMTAFPHGSM